MGQTLPVEWFLLEVGRVSFDMHRPKLEILREGVQEVEGL
jgi:hypothetical protein